MILVPGVLRLHLVLIVKLIQSLIILRLPDVRRFLLATAIHTDGAHQQLHNNNNNNNIIRSRNRSDSSSSSSRCQLHHHLTDLTRQPPTPHIPTVPTP